METHHKLISYCSYELHWWVHKRQNSTASKMEYMVFMLAHHFMDFLYLYVKLNIFYSSNLFYNIMGHFLQEWTFK